MSPAWTTWQDGPKSGISPYIDWFSLAVLREGDGIVLTPLPYPRTTELAAVPSIGDLLPEGYKGVIAPLPGFALPPQGERSDAPPYPVPGLTGTPPEDAVIVGIVDSAVPLGHERFRRADGKGSRILAAWNMAAPRLGRGQQKHLPFGRELMQGDIDRLLARSPDESAFNRAAGLSYYDAPLGDRSIDKRASHGAHVGDLCAGFDPAAGNPSAARLLPIVVNLPSRRAMGTAGQYLEFFALHAIDYIVRMADAIWLGTHGAKPHDRAKGFPVVINLSYGLLAGPKDGRMLLERYADAFGAIRDKAKYAPVRIHLPAGNDNQARGAATLDGQASEVSVALRVPAEDRTPAFVEIWPETGSPVVRVRPPGGPWSPVGQGSPGQFRNLIEDPAAGGSPEDRTLARLYCRQLSNREPGAATVSGGTPAMRKGYLLAIRPTATWTGQPAAPPGAWEISVSGGTARLYVQSDQSLGELGQDGPRAWFDDPAYVRHDRVTTALFDTKDEVSGPKVSRRGTMNAVAHGGGVAVIAGYRRSDGRADLLSASGTTGNGAAPTVALPSKEGASTPGLLAAGTRSGSALRMGGTSVACALASRLAAEALLGWHAAGRDPQSVLGSPAWLAGQQPTNPHGEPREKVGAGLLPGPASGRISR